MYIFVIVSATVAVFSLVAYMLTEWSRVHSMPRFTCKVIIGLLVIGYLSCVRACESAGDGAGKFANAVARLPYEISLVALTIIAACCIWGVLREDAIRRKSLSKRSLREAVDNLECGLLFAEDGGNVVLSNRKINELARVITGHSISNAEEFWTKIISTGNESFGRRIDFTLGPSILFNDGNVWSFRRSKLTDREKHYNEISAYDVTGLYIRSLELARENAQLKELENRLSESLKNIAETKQQEELLAYKVRVHDQLGNACLSTKRALMNDDITDEIRDNITSIWQNTLNAFKMNDLEKTERNSSSYTEVEKIAGLLNMNIEIGDNFDKGNELAVRCVKEALYNAAKHTDATCLKVTAYRENGLHLIITDNGSTKVTSIQEGGGLTALRRAVESAGGTMCVEIQNGVMLKVCIPE